MADPLLDLQDVHKAYRSPTGEPGPTILGGVSMTLQAGEAVAVVGPSGSGKSTLLNIIGALDRPDRGTVRLEGEDLAGMDERQLAELRNRRIGFVFQLHHLLPQCTALENVLVPTLAGHAGGGGDEPAPDRARALLERVGLGERLTYRPGQLSGGERQRVAVARALVNEPRLLLADEPTGSLDRASADALADLLAELNTDDGVTLVVVTHDRSLADRMARELELREGRLEPLGG